MQVGGRGEDLPRDFPVGEELPQCFGFVRWRDVIGLVPRIDAVARRAHAHFARLEGDPVALAHDGRPGRVRQLPAQGAARGTNAATSRRCHGTDAAGRPAGTRGFVPSPGIVQSPGRARGGLPAGSPCRPARGSDRPGRAGGAARRRSCRPRRRSASRSPPPQVERLLLVSASRVVTSWPTMSARLRLREPRLERRGVDALLREHLLPPAPGSGVATCDRPRPRLHLDRIQLPERRAE